MTIRSRKRAAIPEPAPDARSLYATIVGLKERVETMSGHRGPVVEAAITWQDLLDLGLIKPEQVPQKFTV